MWLWYLSSGLQFKMHNRKIIFLFLNQNICCGYSKEPSQWDGYFEHPKHMFKLMGKKIFLGSDIAKFVVCFSHVWCWKTTFRSWHHFLFFAHWKKKRKIKVKFWILLKILWKMEHLLQKSKCSIFHNILKYMIFQRHQKALLWSKVLLSIY